MADTTTKTPYMNLDLPIPGLSPGLTYAQDQNNAFQLVDSHTHITGQGLPIPTAAININADLPFNLFNQTGIRSSQFNNNGSPLSLPTDLNCISVTGGELYYNDGSGNQVQITLSGQVNVSGSGNITGMGATTASVVYTNANKFFSFYSASVTPAKMLFGPISIGTNAASPNTVSLTAPASGSFLSGSYSLTLPTSLPSQTSFWGSDSGGTTGWYPPDNVTTTITGGQLVAMFPAGCILPTASINVPAGWLLCDGSIVSRTTYATLFAAIGTAYGSGNGSTTFQIPDLRGQFLRGVSGASGNDPDATSRTASGSGGNTGNNIGSEQNFNVQSHNHTVTDPTHNHTQSAHTHAQNAHNHGVTDPGHTHGIPVLGGVGSSGVGIGAGGETVTPGTHTANTGISINNTTATNQNTTATNIAASTGISVDNTGGNESRPINIYVNFIVKT